MSRLAVDAIHIEQVKEHGGLPGVRDENALEAALARARNKWAYGEEPDMNVLAAAVRPAHRPRVVFSSSKRTR